MTKRKTITVSEQLLLFATEEVDARRHAGCGGCGAIRLAWGGRPRSAEVLTSRDPYAGEADGPSSAPPDEWAGPGELDPVPSGTDSESLAGRR